MNNLTQIFALINALWIICGSIGGFFAFRHAVKTKVIELQHETIDLLKTQIDTLEQKVDLLKEENVRQSLIIETIQAALKQKGIIVTIDGDLVTISDGKQSSSVKRSAKSPTLKKVVEHPDVS